METIDPSEVQYEKKSWLPKSLAKNQRTTRESNTPIFGGQHTGLLFF